jgi:hypothetical protein
MCHNQVLEIFWGHRSQVKLLAVKSDTKDHTHMRVLNLLNEIVVMHIHMIDSSHATCTLYKANSSAEFQYTS